jgi:hypothetical protein
MSPRSLVVRLAATVVTLLVLVTVGAFVDGGTEQARAVAQQPAAPVTLATPAPLSQRDQLLAALDSALLRSDWAAATRISAGLRVTFPNDGLIAEKAYAAHVNGGDAALGRGQRDEAVRLYLAARQIKDDPQIAAKLATLVLANTTAR